MVSENRDTPPARESQPVTPLRFHALILGPLALERDGESLDTAGWQPKVATLFRLLVTAPDRQRLRDDLIEILWPDASPDTAATNLRMLARRLRLAIGGDVPAVISNRGWVSLNPDCSWSLDLDELESVAADPDAALDRMESAASLYRGEPLIEERYEDWAVPVRERALRAFRTVIYRLASGYESQGGHERAVGWLERLADQDPLDEEAVRRLMTSLTAAGKRADALRRYRRLVERVEAELDAPVSEATRALALQLSSQSGPTRTDAAMPRPSNAAPLAMPAIVEDTRADSSTAVSPVALRSRRKWRDRSAGSMAVAVCALVLLFVGRQHGIGIPGGSASSHDPFTFQNALVLASGSGPGQFRGPSGVAVDHRGDAYAGDVGNGRIQHFSPDGIPIQQFGHEGGHIGELSAPNYVAVLASGRILVDDFHNRRILTFDRTGIQIDEIDDDWGSLAVDSRNDWYVANFSRKTLREYSPGGGLLHQWDLGTVHVGRRPYPPAIAIDTSGFIYVAERGRNRIVKYERGDTVLRPVGQLGSGLGLHGPSGVAVDRAGNVYVADTMNDRIVKLSPAGAMLRAVGSSGSGAGQFNRPSSVALDPRGNVLVTDFFNNRIVKLSPSFRTVWATGGAHPLHP